MDVQIRYLPNRRGLVLLILTVALLVGCSAGSLEFQMVAEVNPRPSLRFWGTTYHVHQANSFSGADAVPLGGGSLTLTIRDWCHAAREGTVRIRTGSSNRTFNHAGLGHRRRANCAAFFPEVDPEDLAKIERVEFREVPKTAPFGLSSDPRFRLVPYRTVAVDSRIIPLGTTLYIPGLDGRSIPDGKHDGFVFAADTGTGIRENHLDFFLGAPSENPAPDLFAARPSITFEVVIVRDPGVIQHLRQLHSRNSGG